MYRHEPEYVWIEWEWDTQDEMWSPDEAAPEGHDYGGFRAKVRLNPNAGEVRAELKARLATLETPPSLTYEEYLAVLADRVPQWEYELADDAGEVTQVPAPGEQPGNELAFDLLPLDLRNWLIRRIRTAHLPKATTQPLPPAGTMEPTTQNGTVPAMAPQPS